jgi:hypothetical protein
VKGGNVMKMRVIREVGEREKWRLEMNDETRRKEDDNSKIIL